MTVKDLIEKRAKVWDAAKKFVDTHEDANGVLSAEDAEVYDRMEKEIEDLTAAIDRQQRAEAREASFNMPVNAPLTGRPDRKTEEKTGRALSAYKEDFGAHLRGKRLVHNVLSEGVQADGGEEYELPVASRSEIGGVKVGDGLKIDRAFLSIDTTSELITSVRYIMVSGTTADDNVEVDLEAYDRSLMSHAFYPGVMPYEYVIRYNSYEAHFRMMGKGRDKRLYFHGYGNYDAATNKIKEYIVGIATESNIDDLVLVREVDFA